LSLYILYGHFFFGLLFAKKYSTSSSKIHDVKQAMLLIESKLPPLPPKQPHLYQPKNLGNSGKIAGWRYFYRETETAILITNEQHKMVFFTVGRWEF